MSRYDDSDGATRHGSRGRRSRRSAASRKYSRGMRVTGTLAILLTSALVLGSLYAYVRYRDVWDSIKRVDVNADLTKRPVGYGHALNILLIGSDTRSGKNGQIGGRGAQGARSDTVMVLHISPTLHRIVVLSFPRDSVVPILACAPEAGTSGQQAEPGQMEQINSTFAYGGPGCLWHTIEETTHIRLDDFIELDFVGFEKVINDLGGVDVCLPYAVDDPMSGLHLSKGMHHVWGKQALAFWRTREDLGLGSDLQRIQRDQYLMIALLQGVERSGLLRSPTKIASVIGDAAHAMTTDSGMTVSRMLQIAEGLRGLSSKSAEFIEVPSQTYPQETAWVQWIPQDSQLFSAIAHDTKLPKTKKSAKPAKSQVTEAVSPATVKVEVLNGSGVANIASTAAEDLASRGFDVVGNTNASNFGYSSSVVQYATAADLAKAKTVAAQLSDSTLQEDPSLPSGTINLILGSSFTTLSPKKTNSSSSTASVGNLSHTYGGLTGNANVCGDQGAFAS
jgi:LCP family protein required for cell wall assembly